MLSLALLSVITAVAGGGPGAAAAALDAETAPDAETLHRLQQLDLAHRELPTPSPAATTTTGAAVVSTAEPSARPAPPVDTNTPPNASLGPGPTPAAPAEGVAAAGWGLPAADVLTRARGGVQGLRTWSSKRLGQLGSSLAETVETVKVKGNVVHKNML